MKTISRAILCLLLIIPCQLWAQTDLFAMMDTLEKKNPKEKIPERVIATFKSTRIINGHTIETLAKHHLDFRISHRFGTLNGGFYELWGLDNASMRLGFEYGLTDRIMIGLGRSSYNKIYDSFIKYRILEQTIRGNRNFPFSLALVGTSNYKSLRFDGIEGEQANRLSYAFQMLLARKMDDKLSLQFSPSIVHRNLVLTNSDPNDLYALGIGGRYKLSPRVSFNVDYFLILNKPEDYINSLSLGLDIETGGHVFQLHMTNSAGMTAPVFIAETSQIWENGGIFFGFNVSRIFALKKIKKPITTKSH